MHNKLPTWRTSKKKYPTHIKISSNITIGPQETHFDRLFESTSSNFLNNQFIHFLFLLSKIIMSISDTITKDKIYKPVNEIRA